MSQSLKLPMAIHIMLGLALNRDKYLNSVVIAQSVGTNAAVIRKNLQKLKAANLVVSLQGSNGGTKLNKEPSDISLLDICNAIDGIPRDVVHEGSPDCPIACGIAEKLPSILAEAKNAQRAKLSETTLRDLMIDLF